MKCSILTYLQHSVFLILIALSLTNCQKEPKIAFHYEPSVNPEIHDTIWLINETEGAESYEWDFGNGELSSDFEPITFYTQTGQTNITLTATNKVGTTVESLPIVLNMPTILDFYVFEDDSITALDECELWLYDNEEDWDELNMPQLYELTESDGYVQFLNLEDQVYFIIAVKEVEEGIWISGGYTANLTLNQANTYMIVCDYYPYEDQDSLKKSTILKGLEIPLHYELNSVFPYTPR